MIASIEALATLRLEHAAAVQMRDQWGTNVTKLECKIRELVRIASWSDETLRLNQ